MKLTEKSQSYIIAEAGVNHNGNVDLALQLIREARKAGADCVKFQTFKAEAVATKKAPKAEYQLHVTDIEESQLEMLKKLELPEKSYPLLLAECKKNAIDFLSTPYNEQDAVFLNELDVKAFKIASGQIVELSFLRKTASFGKPVILSTGMATLSEVAEAVDVIRNAGCPQVIVLQCTTNYPSDIKEANVLAMVTMGGALGVEIGYSDHVESNFACYAAVALGARVIEKHFTLDRKMAGPDHSASLNPEQFAELVRGVRSVEQALGSPLKHPSAAEIKNAIGMRRSIVAREDISAGSKITESMLTFKRPATGISPHRLGELLGKVAARDILADELVDLSMITW
jgi:N,N'-diacetyllegionaminate synthase